MEPCSFNKTTSRWADILKRRIMRIFTSNGFQIAILSFILLASGSCQNDKDNNLVAEKNAVEKGLEAFVATFESDFPADEEALKLRIQTYLLSSPSYFYGATVSILDTDGIVAQSPYYFQKADNTLGYSAEIMSPEYQIDIPVNAP